MGKILAEMLHVLDPRATPAVDRLVVVAHYEDIAVVAHQVLQPRVLDGIGVLEFVHQHMPEAITVMAQQTGMGHPQFVGAQQHFGEVDQACTGAGVFVGAIDVDHGMQRAVTIVVDVLRSLAVVLARVDEPLRLLGWPFVVVQIETTDDALHDPQLIVGIDDLEIVRQAGVASMGTQHAVGDVVESANPHAANRATGEGFDAPAHLRCGLVGEGHRQDAERRGLAGFKIPSDTMHQHTGLAAAGAGQHQHLLGRGCHRVALTLVHFGENGGIGHQVRIHG